jgi:hypothetical protein
MAFGGLGSPVISGRAKKYRGSFGFTQDMLLHCAADEMTFLHGAKQL